MRLLQPAMLRAPRAAAVTPRARDNYGAPSATFCATMNEVAMRKEEIVRLACEWRRMQDYAGHEELRAKLAALGQACDRYERPRP